MPSKRNNSRGAVIGCLLTGLVAQSSHTSAQQAPTPAAPGPAAPVENAAAQPTAPAPAAEPTAAQPQAAEPNAVQGPATVSTGEVQGTRAEPPATTPNDVASVDAELSHLLIVTPPAEGGRTAQEIADRAVVESSEAGRAKLAAARAEEQADDAYSLFLPRVDLKATYTRLSPVDAPGFSFNIPGVDSSAFGGSDPAGVKILDRYSLTAAVRIPVSEYFLSLKDYYDNAQTMEVVAQLQHQGEVQAVIANAKTMFYQLARAQAARQLAEMRIRQLAEFTREIEALVQAGSLSSVELAQANARQASAEAALQQAAASARVAEMTLRAHLDMDMDERLAIGEPLLDTRPAPPGDFAPLVKQALTRRPEALALTELIKAHGETADAIAWTRYPTLSLFGNVNYDNPNQRLFPVEKKFYPTWAVGAEIAWSPTALATQNSQLKDAKLQVAQAKQDLRGLHARIVIEVSNAYEQAVSAEAALAASEAAVKAAREALDARLALFHAGEATTREWMDAELELRSAQLQYIDNVLTTHMARAALDHVTAVNAK